MANESPVDDYTAAAVVGDLHHSGSDWIRILAVAVADRRVYLRSTHDVRGAVRTHHRGDKAVGGIQVDAEGVLNERLVDIGYTSRGHRQEIHHWAADNSSGLRVAGVALAGVLVP